MEKSVVQVLREAAHIIEEGYARGSFAKKKLATGYGERQIPCRMDDPDACCYCSLGAIGKVTGVSPEVDSDWYDASKTARKAALLLTKAARELWPSEEWRWRDIGPTTGPVIWVNDELGLDGAKRMFARAIELAEQ